MDCPYAYLAVFRLRQVWPEFKGRVQVAWRALALEYINKGAVDKPGLEAELAFFPRLEPDLPLKKWSRPDWQWPVTMWPAFEALACAQGQNEQAAFEMSWALRHSFFARNRCLSLRHEILAIAEEVAKAAPLDLERFEDDWDGGRYKQTVIAESRDGWHELKVEGRATFVLPNGRQITNPAVGEIDYDEANHVLRSLKPPAGDPLDEYRAMLEAVAKM